MFRVGFGQDSHRFSKDPQKKLVLGGVLISGESGLEANSDGDVVAHALCSALEQAIGGEFFSIYTDEMCRKGITNSLEYLEVALSHVKEKGYIINNMGISFECQRPKIIPIASEIKEKLVAVLEISEDRIGINATSGEDLTPFGKGEGIQVFAIVSLMKK